MHERSNYLARVEAQRNAHQVLAENRIIACDDPRPAEEIAGDYFSRAMGRLVGIELVNERPQPPAPPSARIPFDL